MSNGIFSQLPFSEYLAIDAMNCSTLKKVAQSPLHAKHELVNPSEPTAAFVIGDAFHALVLEPERFNSEFALAPDRGKRTKADKDAWEVWHADHAGMTALKSEELDALQRMKRAVLAHPLAAEILAGTGENEVTFVWEDPETGARCKARADRLTQFRGESVIADLKSTIDASPDGWGRSSARFQYHMQAAWYLAGAHALAPSVMDRRFLFLCCEKKAPFGVTVQELDADAIQAGAKLNRILLQRWLKCVKTKKFTGYTEEIVPQQLPPWALHTIDRLEE